MLRERAKLRTQEEVRGESMSLSLIIHYQLLADGPEEDEQEIIKKEESEEVIN